MKHGQGTFYYPDGSKYEGITNVLYMSVLCTSTNQNYFYTVLRTFLKPAEALMLVSVSKTLTTASSDCQGRGLRVWDKVTVSTPTPTKTPMMESGCKIWGMSQEMQSQLLVTTCNARRSQGLYYIYTFLCLDNLLWFNSINTLESRTFFMLKCSPRNAVTCL